MGGTLLIYINLEGFINLLIRGLVNLLANKIIRNIKSGARKKERERSGKRGEAAESRGLGLLGTLVTCRLPAGYPVRC